MVALGVGAYFGVQGLSKWSERNDHCGDAGCDATGVEAGEDASTYAYVSDVGFGLGLLGVGTAAYLLLTGSEQEDPGMDQGTTVRLEPRFGLRGGELSIGGRW